MANFLRSFATGFVSAANERFAEDRRLQIANDLAKSKRFNEKLLPEFLTNRAKSSVLAKEKEDAATLRAQLGISPTGEARIQSGLGAAEDALKFRQDLTPEQRARFDAGTFTPGQPGQQSLEQAAGARGFSTEDIRKAGIDPSQFPGQAAVSPQFTGPGIDIAESGQAPQDKRLEALATGFINKPQFFADQAQFGIAKNAFVNGDFEAVIVLAEQQSKAASRALDPIINKLIGASALFEQGEINSVFEVLNPVEIQTLFLLKNIDPINAALQARMLSNPSIIAMLLRTQKDAAAKGENPPPAPNKPPGPNATDEELSNYGLNEFPKLKAVFDWFLNLGNPDTTQ